MKQLESNEGERIRGRGGDDTIAVGIREGDEEEEGIVDGDSLDALVNCTQSAHFLRSVCGGGEPQDRCNK